MTTHKKAAGESGSIVEQSVIHNFYADKYIEYSQDRQVVAAYACRLLMALYVPTQPAPYIEARDAKHIAFLTGLTSRQTTMILASLEAAGLIEFVTIETSAETKEFVRAVIGGDL